MATTTYILKNSIFLGKYTVTSKNCLFTQRNSSSYSQDLLAHEGSESTWYNTTAQAHDLLPKFSYSWQHF